ncbi:MAG: bifunctional hydroxymethylpyrimidine kinase/phosphomethylpyrimidine kinase [Oscillospiraceae bacterium]|nr:bifunctional hydroxymethylpyrimidine kinase/phosphomethylpyrimidine kinase [Oscillospiraceae bacterium]
MKGFPEGAYIPTGRNVGDVKYIHGGCSRNVVEDIANMELRPIYVGIVDDSPLGADVLQNLKNHKVNCDYMLTKPDGMGLWLAVFDSNGDVAGSISKRPDLSALLDLFEEKGDEIFSQGDAVVLEVDMERDIVKKILSLAEKYNIKSYALVSNMSIAAERRDLLQRFDCFICNQQEAGLLFLDNYEDRSADEMRQIISDKVVRAQIPSMVVTLGSDGAIYADKDGNSGFCPARNVHVKDTTGAGDAFCAGVAAGLTYGKTLEGAVEIGTMLAASVITSSENICPRFRPEELDLSVPQK